MKHLYKPQSIDKTLLILVDNLEQMERIVKGLGNASQYNQDYRNFDSRVSTMLYDEDLDASLKIIEETEGRNGLRDIVEKAKERYIALQNRSSNGSSNSNSGEYKDSVLNYPPEEVLTFINKRENQSRIFLDYLKRGLTDLKKRFDQEDVLKNRPYFTGEYRYGVVISNSPEIIVELPKSSAYMRFGKRVAEFSEKYDFLKQTSFGEAVKSYNRFGGTHVAGFLRLDEDIVVERIKNRDLDVIVFCELAFSEFERTLKGVTDPFDNPHCSEADSGYNTLLSTIQENLNLDLSTYFERMEKILGRFDRTREQRKKESRIEREIEEAKVYQKKINKKESRKREDLGDEDD